MVYWQWRQKEMDALENNLESDTMKLGDSLEGTVRNTKQIQTVLWELVWLVG